MYDRIGLAQLIATLDRCRNDLPLSLTPRRFFSPRAREVHSGPGQVMEDTSGELHDPRFSTPEALVPARLDAVQAALEDVPSEQD